MNNGNRKKLPEKFFMVLAGIETLFFLSCFTFGERTENLKQLGISGLILCGLATCVAIVYEVFTIIKNRQDLRIAAVRALGKHGLKVMAKEESARTAYKGILKFMQGHYADAEELLQSALSMSEIQQNRLFCIEWLIKLYEIQDNEGRTLWCFRRAAEIAPDNPTVQSRLGHAYYADGKLSNAEYCFEQALKYDPNNGYSYFCLAKIYMVRGEDKKAFDTLKTLEGIQSSHPLVNAELATWYAMHDDEQKAEEYYDKAVLCGYIEPDKLSKRMTALRMFNHAPDASGADLPHEYYRHIEKEDTDAGDV